jgi:hypothetical protein
MGAVTTWPDDDDDDEFEVIMGHPCFQGPEPISLPEAMDTAHAALSQVWHVLQLEWDQLGVEQQCLKEWGSLLKRRTKFVQQKAVEKRAHLDAMEKVLREEQVAIRRLDQSTQELLEETKAAHAVANAHVSAYAKLLEDFEQRVGVVSQRGLVVVKR